MEILNHVTDVQLHTTVNYIKHERIYANLANKGSSVGWGLRKAYKPNSSLDLSLNKVLLSFLLWCWHL
jgi:hypothetical protein